MLSPMHLLASAPAFHSLTTLSTSKLLLLVGLFVGFVSGLFGKGGSAIATPLLQLIGIPPFFAVASPLPAAIPGTLVASIAYLREGLYNKRLVMWSIAIGLPATLLGAWLSKFVGGKILLLASNLVIVGLGISFLLPHRLSGADKNQIETTPETPASLQSVQVDNPMLAGIIVVSLIVGLVSGLLANSGGFLFAPLYNKVLKLPLKTAFACSLLVSAALAVPGTIVHVALGHIDWHIVLLFALGSIPFSYLGARTAIRLPVRTLEPMFGIMLTIIGIWGTADSLGLRF